jgi:hypothetical protein
MASASGIRPLDERDCGASWPQYSVGSIRDKARQGHSGAQEAAEVPGDLAARCVYPECNLQSRPVDSWGASLLLGVQQDGLRPLGGTPDRPAYNAGTRAAAARADEADADPETEASVTSEAKVMAALGVTYICGLATGGMVLYLMQRWFG